MSRTGQVMNSMILYYAGNVRRINHFLKVYGFAKVTGEMEGLNESTQEIIEIAALTHDIGIKNSEKKYNSSTGNYQQIEGPPEAKKLLKGLGIESETSPIFCCWENKKQKAKFHLPFWHIICKERSIFLVQRN